MATSKDLREPNDGVANLYLRVQQLRTEAPVPFSRAAIGIKTSGLDCLIQVIRHANSFYWEHPRLPEEEINPILPYAWQDFKLHNNDHELLQSLVAGKKRLVDELRDLVPGDFSFASLAKSSLMNSTLWSSSEWALARKTLDLDTGETGSLGTLTQQGKASLLQYHCHQESNVDLQTFIGGFFMPETSKITVSRHPTFVRVEYLSNPSKPWSIADLRAFNMPLGRVEIGDAGPEFVLPSAWQTYFLVAVVKMRRPEADDHDFVRTYTSDGHPVEMAISWPSFMSDDWSLSDTGGHSYMLFYIKKNGGIQLHHPETSLPAIRRLEMSSAVLSVLDYHRRQAGI